MKPVSLTIAVAAFAFMAGGAFGPQALAQTASHSGQSGVTSGPAASKAVVPNTAPYNGSSTTKATADKGAVGAGAPGMPAKKGTEAGRAQTKSHASSKQG